MPLNSRSKGARAERQWRDELRNQGYTAERGQQRSGSPDSPDVKCPSLPDIHFEVKHVERLNIYDAIEQAQRDAAEEQLATVAHKKNNKRWLVTMYADDWFTIIKESEFTK